MCKNSVCTNQYIYIVCCQNMRVSNNQNNAVKNLKPNDISVENKTNPTKKKNEELKKK